MSNWWDEPVPVRLTPSMTFSVADPERAARILLTDLPGDTAKHRAARRALLRALETAGDHKRMAAARKAFAAAVEEAGALGLPANRSTAEPVKTRWRGRRG
jgi:hypothetical protein